MEDQVKAGIVEDGEVSHIPLDAAQVKTVSRSYFSVLLQLTLGKIEDSDVCPCRRQKGRLLTSAGGQTKYAQATYII